MVSVAGRRRPRTGSRAKPALIHGVNSVAPGVLAVAWATIGKFQDATVSAIFQDVVLKSDYSVVNWAKIHGGSSALPGCFDFGLVVLFGTAI